MKSKREMFCPYCNEVLEEYDVFDTESYDDHIIDHIIGGCHKCGREFQWRALYAFVGCDSFVEEPNKNVSQLLEEGDHIVNDEPMAPTWACGGNEMDEEVK